MPTQYLPYEIDALTEAKTPAAELLNRFRYFIDNFRFPTQMLSELEMQCLMDNFNASLVNEHNEEHREGTPEQLTLYDISTVLEYPVWLYPSHANDVIEPDAIDNRTNFEEWYSFWLKSLEEQAEANAETTPDNGESTPTVAT